MPITINGSGTVTGISAGGLPDASITADELASGAVTQVKLASGVAGSGPAFMAESSVDQSVTSATWTKVTLGNEVFDTDSCFASSRFTPTVAGYYQFNGIVRAVSASNNVTNVSAGIYKNGALYAAAGTTSAGASGLTTSVPSLVYLNGSTDYVELYGSVTGTSPSFDYTSAGVAPQLSGCLVRAA